jgi:hypothetical protein
MKTAVALVALLFCSPAWTCAFDTDCAVGSRCAKSSGQIYGYCVGGMTPGNSNACSLSEPLVPEAAAVRLGSRWD